MTAISGSVVGFRSMADGTLQIRIGFNEAESRQAMRLLCDVGAAVAIARLQDGQGDAQTDGPSPSAAQETKAPHGQQAKALRLSGFFRAPGVWQAVGTDAEFLAWLRTYPCAFCGAPAPSEAAHIRRIANGAGIGIKPSYSAVPLCHTHHAEQHQYGESALVPKEEWDKRRISWVQSWCWETLKAQLGYAHWNQVPPEVLREWADKMGISTYLPAEYKV